MRLRWIIPERVNERIEEAVEKAMKSQMESTGGIPRAGDEKRSMDDLTALAKSMLDTREYGISVDDKNDVAGEVNEMANESANDIKYFTEEEKETYNKTIERFLNIGITGKNRIILEMAKEINDYRKKILAMKEEKKSEMEMLQAGGPVLSGVLRVDEPCVSVSFPIIDALPNDLRERMESVSMDPDGRIFICFKEVNHGADK